VISVDTMTAHLAGALGRNTWTLLPFDADWRWMKDREDCPWYPTMRLFRQQRQGDWSGLVAEVAIELQRKLNLQEPNRTELTRTSQLSRGLQKQSR
jgi:ADP-heptose:LPS heptosyltransferase